MDINKVFATLLPNAVPTLFKFGPSPISYKRKIITSETAVDTNLEIRPNDLKKPMKSEFNEHGYCYNFPKLANDNSEDPSDKGNCMVGSLYVCVYFRSSSKSIYSQWASAR